MAAELPTTVYVATCVVIYVIAAISIITIPIGLCRAAARAGIPIGTRIWLDLIVTGCLACWFAYALGCLAPRLFHNVLQVSLRIRALTSFLIPLVLGALVIMRSTTARRICAAMPSHWPIAIQTFRLLGAVFLIYLHFRALPAEFALWAGWGDVAVGALAPVVAWNLAKNARHAVQIGVAWNLMGLADFASAIGHAIHSGARIDYP